MDWRHGRYYYCVRNRLYLEHRHGAQPVKLGALALGYLVQGWRNRLGAAAARGIVDAYRLGRQQRRQRPRAPLSPATRSYLREHEGLHGSSVGERCRAVLSRLPPDPPPP
jgi:hypothetical protein